MCTSQFLHVTKIDTLIGWLFQQVDTMCVLKNLNFLNTWYLVCKWKMIFLLTWWILKKIKESANNGVHLEPYVDMKGDLKGYAKNLSFLPFFFDCGLVRWRERSISIYGRQQEEMPWIAMVGGVTRSWKRDRSKTKRLRFLSWAWGGSPLSSSGQAKWYPIIYLNLAEDSVCWKSSSGT